MPTFHEKVIQQGLSLGYSHDTEGVCFGFTMRWLEASLSNKMERFLQHTKIIENNISQKQVNDLRLKSKTAKLSEEEQLLLDLPAFYEGLLIYLQPKKYPDLFSYDTRQMDLDRTTTLASSKDIEDMGGLSTSLRQENVYTHDSLVLYLENLEEIIKQSNCPTNTKIAISFGSYEHEIAATYDVATKKWNVMDINQWPPKQGNAKSSAEIIMSAFSYKNTNQMQHVISSNLIIPANQKNDEHIKSINNQLKILQEKMISEPLPPITDAIMRDLIKMAIENHDTHMLMHIGKEKISNLYHFNEFLTLSHLAVLNTNVDAISLFSKFGLDLNIQNKSGYTPTSLAASIGRIDILEALVNAECDLKKTAANGENLVHAAAKEGQAHVIEYLETQGVDLNLTASNGLTPMHMAAIYGHTNVIELLHKKKVDLQQTNKKDGATPLAYAAQYGRIIVINTIAKLDEGADKEFAIFTMDYNKFMSENNFFETKIGAINKYLNSILIGQGLTSREKIDFFLNNNKLISSLNQHHGIFRQWVQKNQFYKLIQSKTDINLIGDTNSFKAFNSFKKKYGSIINENQADESASFVKNSNKKTNANGLK